jgi:hypothetical protein
VPRPDRGLGLSLRFANPRGRPLGRAGALILPWFLDERMYLFFDVESIGLHGEGFAVGWASYADDGSKQSEGYAACPPERARGDDEGRVWIAAHVVPGLPPPNRATPREVRDTFWQVWEAARTQGARLVCDVGWPVETSFLSACVADRPAERAWTGPYPLIDVSSVRLAAGLDPLHDESPRQPDEVPDHHPLPDVRRAARLFFEALRRTRGATGPSPA